MNTKVFTVIMRFIYAGELPALQVILSHEKDLIVAAHNLASPNLKSQ
jgi:hypothetical protein